MRDLKKPNELDVLKNSAPRFFAQTVRIKLDLPQAAQLSILYRKISGVAPPRKALLRTHLY